MPGRSATVATSHGDSGRGPTLTSAQPEERGALTLPDPADQEGLTSPKVLASHFLALRRSARKLRRCLDGLRRDQRGEARALLRQAFDFEGELEQGYSDERSLLLALRRAREMELTINRLLGLPLSHEELNPDGMLVVRPMRLGVERSPGLLRPVRWPLRYNTYRFQVLGALLFAFWDDQQLREKRTAACLETFSAARMAVSHEQRKRDVMKHDGVYAVRQKKRPKAE